MKKTILALSLVLFAVISFLNPSSVSAASPDGAGPWADGVVSAHQGLTLGGQPVSVVNPARSNPQSAVGVAENDYVDSHFYSLGFGGSIVLQFDNPISEGVVLVETTNPGWPNERASVELSNDGVMWSWAGNVKQDGEVTMPRTLSCARYVRITDISHPSDFVEAISDGYDVDGVKALRGHKCGNSHNDHHNDDDRDYEEKHKNHHHKKGEFCNEQETVSPTPTPTEEPRIGGPEGESSSDNGGHGAPICGDVQPGVTTLLPVTYKNATTAILHWTKVPGADHYMISYGMSPGNYTYGVVNTGNVDTYEIGSLTPNVAYYFQVYAVNGCQPSNPSVEQATATGYGIGGGTTELANTGSFTDTATTSAVALSVAGTLGFMLKKRFV